MATITASSGFQLLMSETGDIPELQSSWSMIGKTSSFDALNTELLIRGDYFTTYSISVGGAFHYDALRGELTGTIASLTLSGSSTSPYGQNGTLLTIAGADTVVSNASMLNLSRFLHGNDGISGSAYDDIIRGQEGNDALQGGAGNDTLYGGDNSDTLTGGPGRDWMSGGGDTDTFVFSDVTHTKKGRLKDAISDFQRGIDDIDLRGIDADTDNRDGGAGDQAFNWIGSGKFGHIDGQLRLAKGVLQGDTDGDGKADFEIKIGISKLQVTNFPETSDIWL